MTDPTILIMADTHLGLDHALRPKVQRRRRGPEIFANFTSALDTAVAKKVDCLIHGGDLFYRSRVSRALVEMVFEQLKRVADLGIPIFIIPGNHEHSAIPHSEFSFHPNIHVFTHPRTFSLRIKGQRLTFSGFPFVRENIRDNFSQLLGETNWRGEKADFRFLCIHQSVEGACVGPSNFIFRRGEDVIRSRDIPPGFSAILSGHIHRFQVLKTDLRGTPLVAPVFYPGAIDRISFAERDEIKGYLVIKIQTGVERNKPVLQWNFHRLPSRPMVVANLRPGPITQKNFERRLKYTLINLPGNSIVKLKIHGEVTTEQRTLLSGRSLRVLAGQTRNVRAILVDGSGEFSARRFTKKQN